MEQSVSVACNVDLSVVNYSAFFSNGGKRLGRLQCGFVRYNYSAFLIFSIGTECLSRLQCGFVRYNYSDFF